MGMYYKFWHPTVLAVFPKSELPHNGKVDIVIFGTLEKGVYCNFRTFPSWYIPHATS